MGCLFLEPEDGLVLVVFVWSAPVLGEARNGEILSDGFHHAFTVN